MLENREGSKNPFYGSTMVKKAVEDILIHDFDKRSDIAPCGVYATIAIDSKVTLGEGDNGYLAFFSIEEKTYELWVHFEGKHITNITLSEWLESGSFEDGDDADNTYSAKDFTIINIIES